MTSRWADTADDAAEEARRKAEKEEKKEQKQRARAEKQRKAAEALRAAAAARPVSHTNNLQPHDANGDDDDGPRPSKRPRLSPTPNGPQNNTATAPDRSTLRPLWRPLPPSPWRPARSIDSFTPLNHIEAGSYGSVSRARDDATGTIVAVKKLHLSPAHNAGFPVTALREIQCLQAARGHRHIVELREVVVGGGEDNTAGGGGAGPQDVYLVMDFLEHDLQTLQHDMLDPFSPSEVKTLMLQLGSAVAFLHARWILHRDLKTSNVLLNNRGEVKLADFGMARFVGDPAPANLTQLVVTLWYRPPELLLGATVYDTSVDMWSLGCIFGELITREALLPGKNEVEQLSKIFALLGPPTETTWPDFKRLPHARTLRLPPPSHRSQTPQSTLLRIKFPTLTSTGTALLSSLLSLNPAHRPSAQNFLDHPYFTEDPRPKPTAMFPTFPSKAGQEKRRRHGTPGAPVRGAAPRLEGEVDFGSLFPESAAEGEGERAGGFRLKVV